MPWGDVPTPRAVLTAVPVLPAALSPQCPQRSPPGPVLPELPNSRALHADYFNHKRVLSPRPKFLS